MRVPIRMAVRLFCIVALISSSHVTLLAQNTILVGDLHSIDSTFVWDTTVFAPRLPSFALGHQWGAADLDKLNSTFHSISDDKEEWWRGILFLPMFESQWHLRVLSRGSDENVSTFDDSIDPFGYVFG